MLNVALLSKWHVHALDYARDALEHPDIMIKKIWDEDPDRGQRWAEELGVSFERDLSKIWNDPDIHAVIVTSPTRMHKELIMEAARNQKHIFTEKVLAFSIKDCEEIFQAVESSGVQFMISLPRLTEPYYLYAQDIVNRGLLGDITFVRCRVAHNGAIPVNGSNKGWLLETFFNKSEAGGGALVDLGAHPIYLTNRLAGSAAWVTAILTSHYGHAVDDNAIVTVKYRNGALGIIETSFVSGSFIFRLEVHGTEGVLLIDNERDLKISLKNGPWTVPEKLPDPLPTAMSQWVRAIQEGIEPTITKEDAIRLTQINELAALSHTSGRTIPVL